MQRDRPFKRIWGVAYKNVLPGDNPTRRIVADRGNRDQLYNDPAIRLSEADIQRFKTLVGKPICVEHDEDEVVGEIHHYEVDDNGTLRVMARIFTDTDAGVRASKKLERGELNGLSVGYSAGIIPGTSDVASKSFNELTLTEEPFFDGCYVSVQASKNSTYKSNSLWINLSKEMSEVATTENTAAEVAPKESAPPAEVPKEDASSLLKVADGLKQEVDTAKTMAQEEATKAAELAKQLEQLKAQNAALEAYKKQEEERYAAEKKPEAEEVLALHEEMQGKPFPAEVRQEMIATMCSKAPTAMHNAKIICSQAFAYKSQKEATAKAQAEMEALKKKMADMQQEQQIATAQINASKKDLFGMRQGDVSAKGKEELDDVQITAGAHTDARWPYRGVDMKEIFVPNPSKMELSLPYFKQAPAMTVSITASRTDTGETRRSITAVPRSRMDEHVPNSMRNSPTAHWFHAMAGHKHILMSGEDAVVTGYCERKDKEY